MDYTTYTDLGVWAWILSAWAVVSWSFCVVFHQCVAECVTGNAYKARIRLLIHKLHKLRRILSYARAGAHVCARILRSLNTEKFFLSPGKFRYCTRTKNELNCTRWLGIPLSHRHVKGVPNHGKEHQIRGPPKGPGSHGPEGGDAQGGRSESRCNR